MRRRLEIQVANAEQERYWNEEAGAKWVRYQPILDAQIRGLGKRAMECAEIHPGDRVLDVGCGCGDTTIELARRVGEQGRVVGIDLSGPMLERAKQRAAEAAIANVRFVHADAQTYRFEGPPFDLVFSRFGVMFFADPVAAFRNLRRASRAGARLVFVCWQELQKNPWMLVPLRAVLPHLPEGAMPDLDAPGPFAFAKPETVQRILAAAGYDSVAMRTVRETLAVAEGEPLESTVDFLLQMGPAGKLLRSASPEVRRRAARSLEEALEPFWTERGVCLEGTAWIVTAVAPA